MTSTTRSPLSLLTGRLRSPLAARSKFKSSAAALVVAVAMEASPAAVAVLVSS
jgi:hypothetical protein